MTTLTSTPAGTIGHPGDGGSGFFDGFGWSEGATIFAAIAAAAIAAAIAVIGYSRQRKAQRRDERATLYGTAIAAVEDYLEGPYRIRRKDGTEHTRFAISSALSDVKSAISKHQALLEMHAPPEVTDAYTKFVAAAVADAGPQMTTAWNTPAITRDEDVPLGAGYDRTQSDIKRTELVAAMRADLDNLS